jgi:hypothetical protein
MDACTSLEHGNNMFPCFLGHGEWTDMSKIFGRDCFLENEESGLVELMTLNFSWSKVVWINRVETLLNNSPKVSRTMI